MGSWKMRSLPFTSWKCQVFFCFVYIVSCSVFTCSSSHLLEKYCCSFQYTFRAVVLVMKSKVQHFVCQQISSWPPLGVSLSEEEEEWRLEMWRELLWFIWCTTSKGAKYAEKSTWNLTVASVISSLLDLSQVLQSSPPSGGAHDLTFTGQTLQVCLLWRLL